MQNGAVILNATTALNLGMGATFGGYYNLDLFNAERHTTGKGCATRSQLVTLCKWGR